MIDAAIILTRSESLNKVFEKLEPEIDYDGKIKTDKHGKPKLVKVNIALAQHGWVNCFIALRLDGMGGCPVLALGITPNLITDWVEYEK